MVPISPEVVVGRRVNRECGVLAAIFTDLRGICRGCAGRTCRKMMELQRPDRVLKVELDS